MLIPLRTDEYPKRRPLVTQALIALNVAVYLCGLIGQQLGLVDLERLVDLGHFNPRDFKWWQLFTALFLHDPRGIWHLAFNMLALWVFGPPVESRLSRFGFLGFYLMAGALANMAHMMVSPAPVIGASGAIAGVTGLFLALFPRSNVICFYIFTASMIAVSSLWFIGLYFCLDLIRQISTFFGGSGGGVAYMAHLAGYVYGFAVGFVLLGTKVVPREDTDVFFLFKQWRRRAAMRAATRGTAAGAWESASADTGARLASLKQEGETLSDEQKSLAAARSDIHRLASQHELPAAANRYRQAVREWSTIILAEDSQLEIANQLMAEGDHALAAGAYEALLEHYPRTHSAGEVRLMLGVIYARQLQQPARARELITRARPTLADAAQQRLADQLLGELPT